MSVLQAYRVWDIRSNHVKTAAGSTPSVVHLTGLEGFETVLYNTNVLYNLLVAYALAQALVLVLMLTSFIQRW